MAKDIKLNADASGYVKGFQQAAKSTEDLKTAQLSLIKTSSTYDENNKATSQTVRQLAKNGDVLVTKFTAITNKSGEATGRLKQYSQVVESSTAATRKLAQEAEAAQKALLAKGVAPSKIAGLSVQEQVSQAKALPTEAPLDTSGQQKSIIERARKAKAEALKKSAEEAKAIEKKEATERLQALDKFHAEQASKIKKQSDVLAQARAARGGVATATAALGLGESSTSRAAKAEEDRLSRVQALNAKNSKESARISREARRDQQEVLAKVLAREQAEQQVLAVQKAQLIALERQSQQLSVVRRDKGPTASTASLGLGESSTSRAAKAEEDRLSKVQALNARNSKESARAQQQGIAITVAAQKEERRLASIRTQSLKSFRSEVLKSIAPVKSLTTEGKKATKQFELFGLTGKDLTRSFAFSAVFQGLFEIRQQLSQAISLTLQWEKAVAEVTTIANVAAEDIREITRASSEAFGADRLDQTEAAYQAFSNQVVKTRQELEFFINAANELSTTSLATNEQAVNAISSVLKAYSRDVTDAREISATLFKTVELGRLRIGDLANTIGTVAVPAAQLGVEFEELQALLATTTVQGIKYNNAQTLIRGVLTKLIKPTKELSDLLAEWGFNSGQAAVETLGLAEIFGRLEQEGRTSAGELGTLFSRVRAVTGAMIIASEEGGKLYAQNLAKIREEASNVQQELKDGEKGISSYSKALEKITETKEFRLRQQIEEFKTATTEAGEQILKAVDALGLLENGAEAALVATKAVSIGLAVLVGSKLVTAFKAARLGALGFGAALNTIPGAIIVTALSAVALGLFELAKAANEAFSPMKALAEESNKLDEALTKIRTTANITQKNLDKVALAFKRVVGTEAAKQVSQLNTKMKGLEQEIKDIGPAAKRSFDSLTKGVSQSVSEAEKGIEALKSAIETGLETSQDIEFKIELNTAVAEAQFEAYKKALKGTKLSPNLTIEQNEEKIQALIANLQSTGDRGSVVEKRIRGLQSVLDKLSVAKFVSSAAGIEAQLDQLEKKQASLSKLAADEQDPTALLDIQKKETANLEQRIALQKQLSKLRVTESKSRLLDIEKTLSTEGLGARERTKLEQDRVKEVRRLASLNKKSAEETQRLEATRLTQSFKQQDQRKDLLKTEEARFKDLRSKELEILDTRQRIEEEIAKGRKASSDRLLADAQLLLAQLKAVGVDTSSAEDALTQVQKTAELTKTQASAAEVEQRAETQKTAAEAVSDSNDILVERLTKLGDLISKNSDGLTSLAKELDEGDFSTPSALGQAASAILPSPVAGKVFPEDRPDTNKFASELEEALQKIREAPNLDSTKLDTVEASREAIVLREALKDQLDSSPFISDDKRKELEAAIESLAAVPATLRTLLQSTLEQREITEAVERAPTTGEAFIARLSPVITRLERLDEKGVSSDEIQVQITQEITGITDPKVFADEVIRNIQEGIRTGKVKLGK